jgi:hypothetical protein
MSIQDTYNSLILEGIIRDILLSGSKLTVGEVQRRFESFIEDNDTSKPLFKADDFQTDAKENASASKWNNTNKQVLQDLTALYKELFSLSGNSMDTFDRWRTEGQVLEARLIKLEEDISDLLLLAEDTEGYFSYVADVFNDAILIDPSLTTAFVDLINHTVSIGTSNSGATKLQLNDITESEATFALLSRRNLQSINIAPGGELINAIKDSTQFWQTRVYTTANTEPISGEVRIKLGTEPTNLTRITIQLNSANSNSAVQITPLLSVDNINFSQLPIQDITKSVMDSASWNFPGTPAQYVKLIMTKTGHDIVDGSLYVYEFGAKNISFYSEGYSTNGVVGTFMSVAHQILSGGKTPVGFSKLILETCERIPTKTRLDYYLAVSNTAAFIPNANTIWLPISPKARTSPLHPLILNVGDLTSISKTGIKISYDPLVSSSVDRNPNRDYSIYRGPSLADLPVTATNSGRFTFINNNDRILDTQITKDLLNLDTIKLWRNVGTKSGTITVRTYLAGWGYSDPYYKTTVQIDNPAGTNINFGSKSIILDETEYRGNTFLSQGIHTLKVYKDNWVDVIPGLSLVNLKIQDPLYPFNHKLLIEGYTLTDPENSYIGVDLFAEFLMKRVSIFDITNNILKDDYIRYALDLDTGDTNQVPAITPTYAIILKVDDSNSDFLNETFTLKASIINQLFTYFRLKVEFSSTDSTLSPSLDGYKILVGI